MLIPLHVKSHWSLGLGTASVPALVARAAAEGLPALALTDLENLYGQVQLHHECRRQGVRAITGIELRPGFDGKRAFGRREGRLVLLARDDEGYRSLCRIVTRRRAAAPPRPRAATEEPLASVLEHPSGLLVLAEEPDVLARLVQPGAVAREDAALLVPRDAHGRSPKEGARREAARRLGVLAVADADAVLLEPADAPLQRLVTAVRAQRPFAAVGRGAGERCWPGAGEASSWFADAPELLAGAAALATRCTLDLTRLADPRRLLPQARLAAGTDADAELRARCEAALEARGRRGDRAARERLRHELEVIAARGLAGYFLVVAEIAAFARRRDIPIATRGSAAASLVAHLLGISTVDPLAHRLLFERFLHAERDDLPDIDLDVCSRRRDEVIDWVHRRHGRERVAMLATHHTFGARAALQAAGAAFGLRPREVQALSRSLRGDDAEALRRLPAVPLAADAPQGAAAWQLAARLVGMPHHTGTHPGGLVITPDAIGDHAPLERAPKGVRITQYDLRAARALGLCKIDLLGNRCLTQVHRALMLVHSRPEWFAGSPAARVRRLEHVPLTDAATLALLQGADTVGCFQLESPAMRGLLQGLPLRGIEDVQAALALLRPGAAAGAAKAAFARRARGEEEPLPPHPALTALLAPTHGLLLYEEDVTRALARAGGISLAAADRLRAAIVACPPGAPEANAIGARFVAEAVCAGNDRSLATTTWHAASRFAAYSFNAAHAASYAVLAWQSAWLETHAKAAFGCALLDDYGGMYPLRTIAADLQRRGITVLPPSVQESELQSTLAGPRAIRLGLAHVKRLRCATAARLLQARASGGTFADLDDLLRRVRLQYAELQALLRCGACDALPPLGAEGYPWRHDAALAAVRRGLPLATVARLPKAPAAGSPFARTYQALVRAQQELELLGVACTAHPIAVLRDEATRAGCTTTLAAKAMPGELVRVAAVLAASRTVPTAAGTSVRFLTLEDEHGLLEAIAWQAGGDGQNGGAATHEDAELAAMLPPGPWLVGGRVVAGSLGGVHLALHWMRPFEQRARPYGGS